MYMLLIVPLVPVIFALMGVKNLVKTHGGHTILWRLLIGRHYSGKNHTNATFWRDSNTRTHGIPAYRVGRRHHRAGWKNMLRGTGYLCFTVLVLAGIVVQFWLTIITISMVVSTLLSVWGYAKYKQLKTWYASKSVVNPLAQALRAFPDMSEADMEKSIRFNPGWQDLKTGEIGRVMLPASFHANAGEQDQMTSLIRRRLPKPVDVEYRTDVTPQYARIMAAPSMPTLVPWVRAAPDMRLLGLHEVLLGYTADGDKRCWDMGSEEPMMFVSATSRRGKTTLIMSMAAQIIRKGGSVALIDPKEVGLTEFAQGQENVELYADNGNIELLWKGIRKFRDELDARVRAFSADKTLKFPRMTLFIDEVSVFNMRSNARWGEIKPPRAKSVPPIWADISTIIFMGAQFNVNCCVFGQRVDFATLGGLIDGFGTRMLTGHNEQTYNRLIGIKPWMKPQKPRGRFIYYNVGDYPVWIQVPYGDTEEVRQFALEGLK